MTTPAIHEQAWALLTGREEPIGHGMTRAVYACVTAPGFVLKVEAGARSFHNAIEWETWQHVKDTEHRRWFAPCHSISHDGTILVQERTTPPGKRDYPALMPTFLCDFKLKNYGMLRGRIVCHDYGLFHAPANGFSKRMAKVRWWRHGPDGEYIYLDKE